MVIASDIPNLLEQGYSRVAIALFQVTIPKASPIFLKSNDGLPPHESDLVTKADGKSCRNIAPPWSRNSPD